MVLFKNIERGRARRRFWVKRVLRPSLLIKGNGNTIPAGQVSPSSSNDTYLPLVELGVTRTITYTLDNSLGRAPLTIPAAGISVPAGYTLLTALPITVGAGLTGSFQMRFDAAFSASGYAGNVTVVSNDPTNPSYSYAINSDIWLFYATGASNTAELGTATRVQVDGTIASNGSKFAFTAQTTPSDNNDLYIRSQQMTLPSGAALVGMSVLNWSARQSGAVGYYTGASLSVTPVSGWFKSDSNTDLLVAANAALPYTFNTAIAASTDYPNATVWMSNRYLNYWRINGIWRCGWVHHAANATQYFGFYNKSGVGTIEKLRAKPIDPVPFAPPVDLSGAQSAGQTWTAPDGNFILRKVLTTRPSAALEIMRFRKRDNSNYMSNSINSAGLQTLEQVINGVSTALASGGAAVNGSIIGLSCIGASIRAIVGQTQSYSYASAYNLIRETGGELNALGTGGAVSDISIYKQQLRTPSTLGAELVVDGSMSSSVTNWPAVGTPTTRAYSGGRLRLIADAAAEGAGQTISGLTVGEYYVVSVGYDVISGTWLIDISGNAVNDGLTGTGTLSFTFVATATSHQLRFLSSSATGEAFFDNASMKNQVFTVDSQNTILDGVLNG